MKIPALTRLSVASAVGAVLLTLSGCVVAPAPGYARSRIAVGGPPVVGYVWWDGAWSNDGWHRHWVEGHWGPPRY